ncbi:MAG: hypothetical protein IPF49_18205 [Gammaproteobacteria bacterium]|nr:hypothetical protein [Gammaproteobacteria bacterium]
MDIDVLAKACMDAPFPVEPFQHGFFTFASAEEVNERFAQLGRFFVRVEIPMAEIPGEGSGDARIHAKEAERLLVSMLRRAWNGFCAARDYVHTSTRLGKSDFTSPTRPCPLASSSHGAMEVAAARRCCAIRPQAESGSTE